MRSRKTGGISAYALLGCGSAFLIGLPASARAQAERSPEAASASEEAGLEEIVVTAQRRDERLATVPISLTALSGSQLEAAQIRDVQALGAIAPTLTVTSSVSNGAGDVLLGLRGLSLVSIVPNVDSTVGVYVDGVYYARTVGTNLALTDMQRVEVLRGPQGTLFGRNTIGGALSVTTNKPSAELEGKIEATYGNYAFLQFNGVLNVPIAGDQLGVRIVYDHQQHDGYGRNTSANLDLADQNTDYFRGSVRFKPNDGITVDLIADYLNSRAGPSNFILSYLDPDPLMRAASVPAGLDAFVQSEGRDNQAGVNPRTRADIYNATGILTVDLGGAELKTISAYRNFDVSNGADLDGTPFKLGDLVRADTAGEQVSQEIQLSGKSFNDVLSWIVGAFHFRERVSDVRFIETSALGGASIETSLPRVVNKSSSLFAQLTLSLTDSLRATAGLRYVWDNREISYRQPRFSLATGDRLAGAAGCAFPTGLEQSAGSCTFTADPISFSYAPWTLGLDYQFQPNGLLYAKVSRGYRSGGFQQAVIVNPDDGMPFGPFAEESVTSYEAGGRVSLFNNRLRLSGAAYAAKYAAIQQSVPFYPAGGGTVVLLRLLNGGDATIKGVEFEASALLGSLRLDGGIGLVDPEFTSGPYEGSEFVTAPRLTYSIRGELPIVTTAGRITLAADFRYQSSQQFFTDRNIAAAVPADYTPRQIASVTQPGYGLVNAQVSWQPENTTSEFRLWVRNLTDQYYVQRTMSFYGQGFNSSLPGVPRTYGATISYKF